MTSRNERHQERLRALIANVSEPGITEDSEFQIIKAISNAICDIAPNSVYFQEASHIGLNSSKLRMLAAAKSLLWELESGYREDYDALAHADVFGDFFESARHLSDEGYRVAAVVIVGISLETHLRLLAQKNGIETASENGSNKKAALLNDELAKAKIYDKVQQKLILAWQGMRNDAAHGTKTNGQFDDINVRGMIDGIASFITKYPA